MLQAPLPSMPEYDSLDDHFDELEEPGTNLLQDFILRSNGPQALGVSNTTPLSISNGYTSEESDYSVTTPSDEQIYSDMSFLQTADTSELVEVVADFVKDNDLTVLSPQQQRAFADKSAFLATGKMIKGKTSKYRGVTQTSKSSWGAKYSAKRITNTCKTPDEAARAYDSYLKTNYPDKFRKFANFCVRCDSFVNPLGLPEFRNECRCDAVSDGGSTEVESPPTASETDIDDMESHQKLYARQDSNLSISSLKLSFLEDTEPFFDESMLPPLDCPELVDGEKKPIKRDSLTMAAVESFTNDGNLDQIIHDIDRSSSLSKKPSFTSSGFAPPSSSTTTAADFSPEEWQNLSEYLLTEQQVSTGSRPPPTRSAQENNQRFAYKKIHSLDFDPVDAMDQSMAIKQEYASAMDVDDLASAFMPPPSDSSYNGPLATHTATLPVQTHSSTLFPARVEIQTPFLEKYWRNDRKNIQCFPYCPEHGDYYRVRIENLQHRCKGVCRAAIKAQITVPTSQPLSPSGLVLLARCNSTFSRNVALSTQQYLNATEIKNLQTLSAVGMVEKFGVLPDGSGVQFEVTFYPDVWKFEFDLPKKRRHGGGGDADPDNSNSEFLYFFEIDVFYTAEKTSYQRLGHAESMSFQIGNTRTLLRQRNRMTEEPSDSDRVLGVEAMPERKKVKMYLGQLARNSTVTSEDGEYVDPAMESGETTNLRKFADGDALGRIDSKDSAFDLEASEGSDDGPVTYGRYMSPKATKAPSAGADAATVATMAQSGTKTALAAERDNEAVATKQSHDSHSWAQLFSYTLLCVPLSIVFVPLVLVLFVPFLLLPPISGAIVRVLDALSDSELRRANSSCLASDTRFVLDRLDTGAGKGMLRFHGQGAVWSRFIYFFVKLVLSVVVFVPTLVLSVLGLILFPIRPASQALLRAANSLALISRDFTRKSVGKPFGSSSAAASPGVQGDALV